jgi:hypothetical protein
MPSVTVRCIMQLSRQWQVLAVTAVAGVVAALAIGLGRVRALVPATA